MKAMRVKVTKQFILSMLRLPEELSLRVIPEGNRYHPIDFEFVMEDESLPDEFEVHEGEIIPQAMISYRSEYNDQGKLISVELVEIVKVD